MDRYLAWARQREPAVKSLIREFVECESPTDSSADVSRFLDLIAASVGDIAVVSRSGRCLCCGFRFSRRTAGKPILALGHGDTVWPLGTLSAMPFREAEGRLWGPGVLDMKAGLAFFIFAMKALHELETPVPAEVLMLVTPDEETGSRDSRAAVEETARTCRAVLVLEPATGLEGRVKTSRKGVGDYHLTVRGVAAHAGVDFASGASAVLELARQIERISTFTNLKRGITVNPGVISGGSRSNVVAAEARAHFDLRVPRLRDAASLDRRLRALKPFDRRCTIGISGGLNRPPMERSKGIVALLRLARRLARDLDVDLEESSTGGGSDGNFTAALGIPTLDGLGAVGEGAHAAHESILTSRIADRVALLAKLTAAIGAETAIL